MAFKLAASDGFWFTVKVAQVSEAGKTLENHIQFRFKRMDLDQRRERELRLGGEIYQKLIAESDGNTDQISGKFTAELIRQGRMDKTAEDVTDELMEIVSDWKDVKDSDDSDMEFSKENLLRLVRFVPNLANSINDAYRNAYLGELKRGN